MAWIGQSENQGRLVTVHPKMYLKGTGVMSPVSFMLHLRSNVKDWSTP